MLPWSQEAIREAWRLLGWNPRIRGDDAPRVVVCETWWRSSLMNNIGYIFIVRRLGKQSKLILSRLDSISNLELNLRIHSQCGPHAHAGADLQAFLTFCFKPILLSAHKLILLIYGDNTCPLVLAMIIPKPIHRFIFPLTLIKHTVTTKEDATSLQLAPRRMWNCRSSPIIYYLTSPRIGSSPQQTPSSSQSQ